jgi:hypothetical protein
MNTWLPSGFPLQVRARSSLWAFHCIPYRKSVHQFKLGNSSVFKKQIVNSSPDRGPVGALGAQRKSDGRKREDTRLKTARQLQKN